MENLKLQIEELNNKVIELLELIKNQPNLISEMVIDEINRQECKRNLAMEAPAKRSICR